MFCIKCGAALSESSKFCARCGTAVAAKATPVATVKSVTPVSPAVSVNNTAKTSDSKILHLISAGISATMLLCCFLPWVVAGGKGYSLLTVFTQLVEIHDFGGFPFIFCTFIMIAGACILIASIIVTLKRDGTAKGLTIASSAVVFFNLVLFWFFDAAIKSVTGTAVPFLMLILAIANLIFIDLARKAKK